MAEEMTVKHVYPPTEDRVRIKLVKNTKGYGWEISAGGKDGDEALSSLRDTEGKVRKEFGNAEE